MAFETCLDRRTDRLNRNAMVGRYKSELFGFRQAASCGCAASHVFRDISTIDKMTIPTIDNSHNSIFPRQTEPTTDSAARTKWGADTWESLKGNCWVGKSLRGQERMKHPVRWNQTFPTLCCIVYSSETSLRTITFRTRGFLSSLQILWGGDKKEKKRFPKFSTVSAL